MKVTESSEMLNTKSNELNNFLSKIATYEMEIEKLKQL